MVALPSFFTAYVAVSRHHHRLLSPLTSSLSSSPALPLPPPHISKLSPPCPRLRHTTGVALSEDPPAEQQQPQPQKHQLRSHDLVALEYAGLNLPRRIAQDLGHVRRIRQHVNPLRSSLSVPVEVPEWNGVFKDPTLPLMVDIGCGSGRFLMWLAKTKPEFGNYLGLEIREKLVQRADCWVKELELDNIHFLFANASVSFNSLISNYPGPLAMVSILCPDPHFKKRHHKRRVVQKPLVDSIVNNLMPGGKVFVQSDVLEVAVDMRNQFDEKLGALQHVDSADPHILADADGWLMDNPMGIRTEREIHAELEGAKIYRRVYQKKLIN